MFSHFRIQILVICFAFVGSLYAQTVPDESDYSKVSNTMKINVKAGDNVTIFELNDSKAAQELYAQLPLSIEVKDYSDNEKIFYPPKKLNVTDAPKANAKTGTLAYYAPWANVVMFYDNFGSASGLYELGIVLSGGEHISDMTGTIQVEKLNQ